MATVAGKFYYQNDYSQPILITERGYGSLHVTSGYWPDDTGWFDEEESIVRLNRLGVAKVTSEKIEFSKNNVWHRDNRKNLLFIGCNNISEIEEYAYTYNAGLFIEALPELYLSATVNLDQCNIRNNTIFKAVNALVTNIVGKEYVFNVFNNNGASSSIFEANEDEWMWKRVKKIDETILTSTRMTNILIRHQWTNQTFDLVLDTQGAELEVLKGFDHYIQNVNMMKLEVSKKEIYKGGVLFDELDQFLRVQGFSLSKEFIDNIPDHGDVVYLRL